MSDRDPSKLAESRVEFDASNMVSPEFDLDAALNKKGFAEFLAQAAGEFIDMENPLQIQEYFETFNAKEQSQKEIGQLYSSHIKDQLGLTIGAEEKDLINTHLEKQAIEDPRGIEDLKKQLDTFKDSPKQIAKLEQVLAHYGTPGEIEGILRKIRTDRANLDSVRSESGRLGRLKLGARVMLSYVGLASKESRETNDTLADLDATFGRIKGNKGVSSILDRTDRLIITYEKQLALIKEIHERKSALEENFKNAKSALLAGISDVAGMKEQLQERSQETLAKLLDGGSIADLDKAQENLERFQDFAGADESGIDVMETTDVERLQEHLTSSLQKLVHQQITKALESANLGTNTLSRLETALKPVLNREKTGSLEGQDNSDFIKEALQTASDNLGNSAVDKAKRLMIARIISKMNQ